MQQEITKLVQRGGKSPDGTSSAFQAYADFMVAFSSFGDAEREVMQAFEIMPITTGEFWSRATSERDDPRTSILGIRHGLTLLSNYIDAVLRLLARDSDGENIKIENDKDSAAVDAKVLTFFIRDPGTPSLTLKHFALILDAVEKLHGAILTIDGQSSSDLVVGSLDSGSDKQFDLIGIAAAVNKLSETLLECWNRVMAAKAAKATFNYRSACEGIAVLERLKAAEAAGSVSRESAEQLRRTIVHSIDELFSNGVYTDMMEHQPLPPPSSLPVERRRLITHQAGNSTTPINSEPDE